MSSRYKIEKEITFTPDEFGKLFKNLQEFVNGISLSPAGILKIGECYALAHDKFNEGINNGSIIVSQKEVAIPSTDMADSHQDPIGHA